MTDDNVTISVNDAEATITLNRPDLRNALTEEVSTELIDAIDEAEEEDARCVVVRGSEGAFCAGGDVNSMIEGLDGGVPVAEKVRVVDEQTHEAVARVAGCSVPTVASIQGAAMGAGAALALACDVQVASEEAEIGFVFRRVGLGVDSGTSYLLPRTVGVNTAKKLVYTGEVLGAERANELGLITDVFPADEFQERADELVERIASGPTVALKNAKRLIDRGFENSLEGAMAEEALAQGIAFETYDHHEGAEAFLEGRDPVFEGR